MIVFKDRMDDDGDSECESPAEARFLYQPRSCFVRRQLRATERTESPKGQFQSLPRTRWSVDTRPQPCPGLDPRRSSTMEANTRRTLVAFPCGAVESMLSWPLMATLPHLHSTRSQEHRRTDLVLRVGVLASGSPPLLTIVPNITSQGFDGSPCQRQRLCAGTTS